MHAPANGAFFLFRLSTRKRPGDPAARAILLPPRNQNAPLVPSFLAKPVNLDNTVKSARIVFSRWLGWRARVETTPRSILETGPQCLSQDSFPGPPKTEGRGNFRGGLCWICLEPCGPRNPQHRDPGFCDS